MVRFYYIFLIFSFQSFFSQSINNFHIPDSLRTKNYEQLKKSYDKVFRIDNDKAELYANVILLKGKQENNKPYIYEGYYKIAHTKGLKSENGHVFADSLIQLTKDLNDKDYPAKAYIIKGILYNYEWEYAKALDQYILAQKLSKNKNNDQFYYLKKLIGILKTATEENEEALPLFHEYYIYQKNKLQSGDKDVKSYIGSIFSLANCYNKNKEYRKALSYINLGIAECRRFNDYTHYPYFISGTGIANYYLKNYSKAEENHLKAEKNFRKNNDYGNLAITYYFLGKINYDIKKEEKAVKYFVKADSVLAFSKEFYPITRDGYEILIDYYKKTGDKENQLKYIDKLFFADDFINKSKQYLSKEIYKKYDTPILLEQKEELINDLNNKTSALYIGLLFGIFIIFILLFLFFKNRNKIRAYQKQAEILLAKPQDHYSEERKPEELAIPNMIKPEEEKVKNGIPAGILIDIQTKLTEFEIKKGYLKKNITIESLAKELETNRDYLSKSVNELKGKNFSQYLNELRINYIIPELQANERLRKYTISAIAEEIGFNTSESFSNAFKKITGTLPSYYIKIINEKIYTNP